MSDVSCVRDHIPLEQGLRPSSGHEATTVAMVRDHIPLEQGLRRLLTRSSHRTGLCQRPYSIRTRIKTPSCPMPESMSPRQRPYSIRTRIKTQRCAAWSA